MTMPEFEKLIPRTRYLKIIKAQRLMKERNASARGEYGGELEGAAKEYPSFSKQAHNIASRFDMTDLGKARALWEQVKYLVEECLQIGEQTDLEDAIAQAAQVDDRTDMERALDGTGTNPVDALASDEDGDGDEAEEVPNIAIARFKAALAGADTLEAVSRGLENLLADHPLAGPEFQDRARAEARYRLVSMGLNPDELEAA
jgi:hypothetical protein